MFSRDSRSIFGSCSAGDSGDFSERSTLEGKGFAPAGAVSSLQMLPEPMNSGLEWKLGRPRRGGHGFSGDPAVIFGNNLFFSDTSCRLSDFHPELNLIGHCIPPREFRKANLVESCCSMNGHYTDRIGGVRWSISFSSNIPPPKGWSSDRQLK